MTVEELIQALNAFPPRASVRLADWNEEYTDAACCGNVMYLPAATDLYPTEDGEDVGNGVIILDVRREH